MLEREQVLLSSLLRNIEQVYWRTRRLEPCNLVLPEPFRTAIDFAEHLPENIIIPAERLIPPIQTISLSLGGETPDVAKGYAYRFPLKPLTMQYVDFMPGKMSQFDDDPVLSYQQLWDAFSLEVRQLRHQDTFEAYFFTLYFLLKKYFSRVPSVEAPDISFFDQARINAAIADSRFLYRQNKEQLCKEVLKDAEEFLLIEGQVSGIQKFIYHMVSPQQEGARLAKRLKGRSFYLLLLAETIADYLLKRLDLVIPHQLWCCGGHFLILAPNIPTVTYRLKSCYRDINTFLLHEFRGELAVVLSSLAVTEDALTNDVHIIRSALARNVEREKNRKLCNVLTEHGDLVFPSNPSVKGNEFAAPVDDYVHGLNDIQEEIGTKLTQLSSGDARLVKLYLPGTEIPPHDLLMHFQIGEEHISWAINPKNLDRADTIYSLHLNDPHEKFWGTRPIKYGFKFIATHIDTYKTQEEVDWYNANSAEGMAQRGEIKGFDTLAEAGVGGFLGVLRMDVDHLGLLFNFGIQHPHIARIAALSSELELFFTGYVHELCQSQFRENVYITYSGGDDLLVAGAWNQVLELACRVRQDFKQFSCQHPDVDISGGVFLCKGKYPMYRAAEQAEFLLDRLAKANERQEPDLSGNAGQRGAFAIFNHRMTWEEFLAVKEMGGECIRAINHGNIQRTFLYKLLDLHRTWQFYRQVNTARLYYITVRNIRDKKVREKLLDSLGSHTILSHPAYLPVLIGYTGLMVRR